MEFLNMCWLVLNYANVSNRAIHLCLCSRSMVISQGLRLFHSAKPNKTNKSLQNNGWKILEVK